MMDIDKLFSVHGRVAIVTGASRGLGKTLAHSLVKAGAKAAIFSRDEQALAAASREIVADTGGEILAITGDVCSEDDVTRLYREVHDRMGPVDIFVANAAQINRPRKNTWELTADTWRHIVEVTLNGTFFSCQQAAKEMVARGSGKIICIASTSSIIASLGHAPYIAAKGGVLQFVRALALEAAPYGVNVNAIGPTFMRTEMAQASMEDPVRYQQIIEQLPLGRPLETEDLVGACIFLASRASDMVTGQLLLVDAGHTIQ